MHGRVSMQKRCLMNAGLVEVVAGGRRPSQTPANFGDKSCFWQATHRTKVVYQKFVAHVCIYEDKNSVF